MTMERDSTKFRALFDSATDAIMILEHGVIADCNQRTLDMFCCQRSDLIGHSPAEWSPSQQNGAVDTIDQMYKNLAAAHKERTLSFDWTHLRNDGTPFQAAVCLSQVGSRRSGQFIVILRDITDQKKIQTELQSNNAKLRAAHTELISLYQQLAASEEAIGLQLAELKDSKKQLEISEQRYRLAMEASNDAIWDVDLATDELSFSAQWLNRFGLPTNESFPRKLWLSRIHPDDRFQVEATFEHHLEKRAVQYDLEYRARATTGDYIWLHARGKILYDEAKQPIRVIGALTDISDRKQRDEQIYRMAYYDQLTNLPNRRRLEQILDEKGLPHNSEGALLFIDLDNFKLINDSAGHACGDELIASAAEQLRNAVGQSHILARVGGDEFIVILAGIGQRAFIDTYAQRLINLFQSPFSCRDQHFYLSASIGIARFPQDGNSLEDLLKKADNALHRAKDDGRSHYRFFEQSMHDSLLQKLAMESRLRASILTKETFQMHYQPQLDLKTGRVVGMEALMRWHCPEQGNVSPLQFIPIAEETGIITELGDWGLQTACKFCRRMHDAGYKDLSVSVNVSVKQLAQDNYVESVAAALVEAGLQPAALELEITESTLINAFESKVKKLNALRSMGIRTALDDFGTGYSSLTYLQQLPIHTLKIDQAFVNRMSSEESTRMIIESIISLAHRLGISVVAEGIETKEQRDLLQQYGCDMIQGYLIGHPLPSSQMTAWLAAHQLAEILHTNTER